MKVLTCCLCGIFPDKRCQSTCLLYGDHPRVFPFPFLGKEASNIIPCSIWLSNHQPGINLWLQQCSKWLKQWYLLIAHVYAIDASICFHDLPCVFHCQQLCWGIDVEIAGVCKDDIHSKHIFKTPISKSFTRVSLLFHSIWDDPNCQQCVCVYVYTYM